MSPFVLYDFSYNIIFVHNVVMNIPRYVHCLTALLGNLFYTETTKWPGVPGSFCIFGILLQQLVCLFSVCPDNKGKHLYAVYEITLIK